MQPFGRPAARAIWRHGRVGLDLAALSRRDAALAGHNLSPARGLLAKTSSTCLRCHVRAIASPSTPRSYSSSQTTPPPPPPPISSSTPPSSSTSPPKEAERLDTAAASPAAPPKKLPQFDSLLSSLRKTLHELPSTTEGRRSALNQRFSVLMDSLQNRALSATQTLNDMTGYTGIEAIKASNESMERALADAQSRVRSARQAYKTSNTKRATTQREVTTLLARKDSWSPVDLERFTELYRADHVLEGEVISAQEALTEAEAEEQTLSQRLNNGILKRYHEEQIWSDRIRRASTWGTWGLMGMNFLLFVILQFFAEPWRRRRLVRGVVEEERAAFEAVTGELADVRASLDRMAAAVDAVAPEPVEDPEYVAAVPPEGTWQEILTDREKWKPYAIYVYRELFSEKKLEFRMKDATKLALEGALTGAMIVGGIASLWRR
ncbi:Sensitive to high expression protein 9 -like protein [Escovopsis weberi]|uniref:Sensitive to high expression protein 9, mitochondrial n=1 Tax=Escovopsis weberi TaxID=150374 RepID=A0A0N0RUB8_ESCWE|nr:Sensitive to high expression protein 9 -like protein [Escovopsis weberi]